MRDLIISDNVNSLINAKNIINKVIDIDKRLNDSKVKTSDLLVKIKKSNDSSNALKNQKDKGGIITTYNTEKLYELIVQNSNASFSNTTLISELIIGNNQNVKDLSEMINALAMLSGLSFEKISETSAELEEIIRQLKDNSNQDFKNSSQTQRIIISQIERAKDEKKRWNEYGYNLGIINENINALENDCLREINKLKSDILHTDNLEKKFLKQFTSNRIIVSISIVLSFLNFLFIGYYLFKCYF
jgi:hypothetical protein